MYLSRSFTLRALCAATLAISYSATTLAGGFDLPTIAASHQGTSNANGAEAIDPSVIYYNPAGLTRLRGLQVSQGFSLLALRGKVEDMGSYGTPAINEPGNSAEGRPLAGEPYSNGAPGSFWPKVLGAGGLFVSMPVDDMLTVGLGIFAPGGGNLNYKSDWAGAYQAENVAIELININPSAGIRFDDKHSIGFGVSIIGGHLRQKTQIDVAGVGPYLFRPVIQNANFGTLDPGLTLGQLTDGLCGVGPLCDITIGTITDPLLLTDALASLGAGAIVDPESNGSGKVEMYGYGFGYNLGYMYNFSDKTRMGIAYRSESKIKLRGDLEWQLDNLNGTPSGNLIIAAINGGDGNLQDYLRNYLRPDTTAKGNLKLPSRLSVNFFHELTDKIDLLMDYTFIESSIVDEIRVAFSDRTDPDGNTVKQGDGAVYTKWKDSFKVSVGANYHLNDALTLRTGFQFDKTPVPSPEFRHPGAPDSDRYMYSVGANYKVDKEISIDAAYSIVFLEDSLSNYRDPCRGVSNENDGSSCTGNGGGFRGKFSDTSIQVLSLQMNKKF
ncbi:MAG: outer membrane protein transport protein [Paraperlucidibaca sp.]